ncbi:hypothetical protein C8R43DRAFT_1050675 [Mycena crocata]|nr:hypothetical protein C8R43DRAFT_1050675 [Mycena crocata]
MWCHITPSVVCINPTLLCTLLCTIFWCLLTPSSSTSCKDCGTNVMSIRFGLDMLVVRVVFHSLVSISQYHWLTTHVFCYIWSLAVPPYMCCLLPVRSLSMQSHPRRMYIYDKALVTPGIHRRMVTWLSHRMSLILFPLSALTFKISSVRY